MSITIKSYILKRKREATQGLHMGQEMKKAESKEVAEEVEEVEEEEVVVGLIFQEKKGSKKTLRGIKIRSRILKSC